MLAIDWGRWIESLLGENNVYVPDLVIALLAVVGGYLLHLIVGRAVRHIDERNDWQVDESFYKRLRRLTRWFLPTLALLLIIPALSTILPEQDSLMKRLLIIVVLFGIVHLIVVVLSGVEQHIQKQHPVDVADNYLARRLHTRVTVLKRTIITFAVVIALALALMTIPRVRELGASLLASAGLAGLVVGLAARPMLENLIAGVQIALTQPIKIDDVVIVAGEWGWIEEIGTTYVVVRIWDQRRLVVPFSKFLQEPFQNWTRKTAQLLGTVFIHADYTVPVQAVREELRRICEGTELWDERVCVLQVTDAKERTLELRALVSAINSPIAWDLRVHVREKLIEFLQREHPDCLPRTRIDLPRETKHDGENAAPPR